MKQMQCNALIFKTTAKHIWLYLILQIILNTQKNPNLNPRLNEATQENSCQIFYPKKSRHRKFQSQKHPLIIPVT